MRPLTRFVATLVPLLLLIVFDSVSGHAQTVCDSFPFNPAGTDEICVRVSESPSGPPVTFRGPSPLAVVDSLSEYSVDVVLTYVEGVGGIALTIEGTVTRIGAGSASLVVEADGGTVAPLPESDGDLILEGMATNTSLTTLGGAALYPGASGDVSAVPWNPMAEGRTNGPYPAGSPEEDFADSELDNPVAAGAIGVRNVTTFHLNDAGEVIDIPSTAGIGNYPLPPSDDDPPPEEEEEIPPEDDESNILYWIAVLALVLLILFLGGRKFLNQSARV